MLVARLLLVIVALVVCAWLGLGARQAHDLAHAQAILSSSQAPGRVQASRVSTLLDAAGQLNPDINVELTRAQLASATGHPRRAIELAEQATRREPKNALAWKQLALVATGDAPVERRALVEISRLVLTLPGYR